MLGACTVGLRDGTRAERGWGGRRPQHAAAAFADKRWGVHSCTRSSRLHHALHPLPTAANPTSLMNCPTNKHTHLLQGVQLLDTRPLEAAQQHHSALGVPPALRQRQRQHRLAQVRHKRLRSQHRKALLFSKTGSRCVALEWLAGGGQAAGSSRTPWQLPRWPPRAPAASPWPWPPSLFASSPHAFPPAVVESRAQLGVCGVRACTSGSTERQVGIGAHCGPPPQTSARCVPVTAS